MHSCIRFKHIFFHYQLNDWTICQRTKKKNRKKLLKLKSGKLIYSNLNLLGNRHAIFRILIKIKTIRPSLLFHFIGFAMKQKPKKKKAAEKTRLEMTSRRNSSHIRQIIIILFSLHYVTVVIRARKKYLVFFVFSFFFFFLFYFIPPLLSVWMCVCCWNVHIVYAIGEQAWTVAHVECHCLYIVHSGLLEIF